ncbi:DUF4232 domain-containing protein [Streptomyces sp. NPDC004667]|uniref:DUF4232 domain-containing protein n=1 Tax=Streptomyces sp. NPDC004667 TaxID=3154285 RepID=UPI00339E1F91
MSGPGWGRRVGAVAGAWALAGALAGCGDLAERLGESPPRAEPVPCPEGGVRLMEGEGNAAMGLRVSDVRLLNCGTAVYELEGYPEVRLLDRGGRPVEVSVAPGGNGVVAAGEGDGEAARKVVLRPGEAASTSLLWRNLVTDGAGDAAEGWLLEVVPKPGAPRGRLELEHAVDLGNTDRMGLGPWRLPGAPPTAPGPSPLP